MLQETVGVADNERGNGSKQTSIVECIDHASLTHTSQLGSFNYTYHSHPCRRARVLCEHVTCHNTTCNTS